MKVGGDAVLRPDTPRERVRPPVGEPTPSLDCPYCRHEHETDFGGKLHWVAKSQPARDAH